MSIVAECTIEDIDHDASFMCGPLIYSYNLPVEIKSSVLHCALGICTKNGVLDKSFVLIILYDLMC